MTTIAVPPINTPSEAVMSETDTPITTSETVMSETDTPTTASKGAWTVSQTRELYSLRLAGNFLGHKEIAARLGRSNQACRLRLMKLKKNEAGPEYADLDISKILVRDPQKEAKKNTTTGERRVRRPRREPPIPAAPEVPDLRTQFLQAPQSEPSYSRLLKGGISDEAMSSVIAQSSRFEATASSSSQSVSDEATTSSSSPPSTIVNLTGMDPMDPENLAWLYRHGHHATVELLLRRAENERTSPENQDRLSRFRAFDPVGQLTTPAPNDSARQI